MPNEGKRSRRQQNLPPEYPEGIPHVTSRNRTVSTSSQDSIFSDGSETQNPHDQQQQGSSASKISERTFSPGISIVERFPHFGPYLPTTPRTPPAVRRNTPQGSPVTPSRAALEASVVQRVYCPNQDPEFEEDSLQDPTHLQITVKPTGIEQSAQETTAAGPSKIAHLVDFVKKKL